jgi:hypothetical protein
MAEPGIVVLNVMPTSKLEFPLVGNLTFKTNSKPSASSKMAFPLHLDAERIGQEFDARAFDAGQSIAPDLVGCMALARFSELLSCFNATDLLPTAGSA